MDAETRAYEETKRQENCPACKHNRKAIEVLQEKLLVAIKNADKAQELASRTDTVSAKETRIAIAERDSAWIDAIQDFLAGKRVSSAIINPDPIGMIISKIKAWAGVEVQSVTETFAKEAAAWGEKVKAAENKAQELEKKLAGLASLRAQARGLRNKIVACEASIAQIVGDHGTASVIYTAADGRQV